MESLLSSVSFLIRDIRPCWELQGDLTTSPFLWRVFSFPWCCCQYMISPCRVPHLSSPVVCLPSGSNGHLEVFQHHHIPFPRKHTFLLAFSFRDWLYYPGWLWTLGLQWRSCHCSHLWWALCSSKCHLSPRIWKALTVSEEHSPGTCLLDQANPPCVTP